MTKGHKGETCADALYAVMKPGEILRFSELFARVKERGAWTNETVCQHLMSCLVNLPPARLHWPKSKPFLFLHEDGRYELFDDRIHGLIRRYWKNPSI